MNDALLVFGILAIAVATLIAIRRRGVVVQIAAEVVLLASIGAVLIAHCTSPLPSDGGFPAGALGASLRGLAVTWWLLAARLLVTLTLLARGRDPAARDARLFSELIAAIIYIAAALVVLNSVLKLPVAGLLATSGVIAIVLGLALQTTLADVFSGIAVGIEKPFHVGDRVSLSENEGVMVHIAWRSIRIRTDSDDLVTIPNSIVAKGQIINRSVPTRRRATSVEITVPTEIPAERMLDLLRQATMLTPEVLAEPAPAVAIRRSGLASATYAASFHVADTPAILPAKGNMLRQARRLLYHAGLVPAQPLPPTALLAAVPLFGALPPEELDAIAAQLRPRPIDPGAVVFAQGGIEDTIYIVEAGVFELSRTVEPSGRATLARLGPGDHIGEIGLITGAPRGVTMTALTAGHVLELPGDRLSELLRTNADLATAMERSVQRGLDLLNRDAAARAAQPDVHGPALLARIRAFFGAHGTPSA
jgi:small-conductance mechanosensitive channel/CRP-like cAMP-binding protein